MLNTLINSISDAGFSLDAGILCGGKGSRLGGLDKGLMEIQGEEFVARIARVLAPVAQQSQAIINCNRNVTQYHQISNRLCHDQPQSFQSPLLGIQSILSATNADLIIMTPCDTPFFDQASLETILQSAVRQYTNAKTIKPVALCLNHRKHPLHCCLPRSYLSAVNEALSEKHFKLTKWFDDLGTIWVEAPSSKAIENINTPEQMRQAIDS